MGFTSWGDSMCMSPNFSIGTRANGTELVRQLPLEPLQLRLHSVKLASDGVCVLLQTFLDRLQQVVVSIPVHLANQRSDQVLVVADHDVEHTVLG